MNKRHWGTLLLAAAAALTLCACGGSGDDSSPSASASEPESPSVSVIAPVEPEPPPEPVYPYVNPLTGEGLYQDISGKRPIAVMFNNLKQALPDRHIPGGRSL